MINFIIVTHGEFGGYLVEAAEGIVGSQPTGVKVLSVSPRQRLDEMRQQLQTALAKLEGPDGLIVFTDMQAGTPINLAFPAIKDRPGTELISGLNLAMLVTAFTHRGDLSLAGLVEKVVKNGRNAVCDFRGFVRTRGA